MTSRLAAAAAPSVRLLGAAEAHAWDACVASAAGGTFCHLAGWREIVQDVLGHECHYLVAPGPPGGFLGVLPLVRVRSRIFGDFLVSMPFLNDGGPVGEPAARDALAQRAVRVAAELGVDLLELRTRSPLEAPGLATAARKLTVHLPLPDTAEELWDGVFRAKLRSQIRRPQKEGMQVRFGLDQVEPFYEVYARNMRDLGTPVMPRAFFETIARVFPELVELAVVYAGGRPVAAGCGFLWQAEFEITWASSLREYNRHSPNMLLYWSLMERVIARGARLFNFGRCTPGGSTHRFKLQWGGYDVVLPWAQRSALGGPAAPPSPDRPIFRVATAAWRRLPMAVANRLGPVLARGLP